MVKRELDIFTLLAAADRRQGDWFSQQSEAAQKEFSAPVALRFASAIEGPNAGYILWLVNEQINAHLYDIPSKHNDLVYRLIASCGLGKPQKHYWLAPNKNSNLKNNKATKLLIEWYPEASDSEIILLLTQYTRQEFRALLDECGIQSDEAVAMVKDFDKFNKANK